MQASFTLKHTKYCKGIAIILMVIHHLYWGTPNIGIMIGEVALSQRIAIVGKVCVSIFVILSGYGLYKSSIISLKEYYMKRVLNLYKNYIFIVITSIIISLILFYDKFLLLIDGGLEGILKIIITFTGLQYIVGYGGINESWWFITAILILYILFPWIKKCIENNNKKFYVFILIMSFLDLIPLGRIKIFSILTWILPFTIGVYLAYGQVFERILEVINNSLKKFSLIFILFISIVIRQNLDPQNFWSLKFDIILAILIITSVYIFLNKKTIINDAICYLGEKSMDIYYIHMFISNYYLVTYIRSIKSVLIQIIVVIIFSLLWSYVLDIIRHSIRLLKGNILLRYN